jgi:hypothetical protein
METIIDNQNDPNAIIAPERPQFLSVLCILTWIACGLMFISTLWGVLFQPSAEQQYEQIEKIREISPEAAEQMEAALENQKGTGQLMSMALNLIAIGLSAFGAYFMWMLRRKGFYFYLAGETLPYLGFLFGGAEALSAVGSMSTMGPAIVGIAIGGMVVFDILFVVLYAVNLKHMR